MNWLLGISIFIAGCGLGFANGKSAVLKGLRQAVAEYRADGDPAIYLHIVEGEERTETIRIPVKGGE